MRVARAAYFAALDYLECSLWYERPVKSATWTRWLDESPEGGLGVIAPANVCAMRPSAAADQSLAQWRAAMGSPKVGVVVFPTPPAFSPSAHNRDQLQRFFGGLELAATKVWRPSGLWDLATAAKAATTAGVVLGWDPLADPTTPPEAYESVAAEAMYWRPAGLGRKGPLSPDHLDRLAALGEAHPTSWIVLATPHAWKDARRLGELIQK